jgi:hypothetical protein
MALVKSHQLTDYTCGPAILRTALQRVQGRFYPELVLSHLSGADPAVGTLPWGLVKAATKLGAPAFLVNNLSMSDFVVLQRSRYLLLLISTGPHFGHWVLSLPTRDGTIVLDDPWDPRYWTMARDQLSDCWRWQFPDHAPTHHTAVVLASPASKEQRDEHATLETHPWDLPLLAEFPPDHSWPEDKRYGNHQIPSSPYPHVA